VGSVVGGTEGALIAGSADRFNRQLHPTEIDWIEDNAEEFAEQLSKEEGQAITEKEAKQRLSRELLRNVDRDWNTALNNAGAGSDDVALKYLSSGLASLGDLYIHRPESEIPSLGDDPKISYTAEEIQAGLQNYRENNSDSYNNALENAEYLQFKNNSFLLPLTSEAEFYRDNVAIPQDLSAHSIERIEGRAEGIKDEGKQIVDGAIDTVTHILNTPALETAESIIKPISQGLGNVIVSPDGVVEEAVDGITEFFDVHEERAQESIIARLQGDEFSAGRVEGESGAEIALAVIPAARAGGIVKLLDGDSSNNVANDSGLGENISQGEVVEVPEGNPPKKNTAGNNGSYDAEGDFGALNQQPKLPSNINTAINDKVKLVDKDRLRPSDVETFRGAEYVTVETTQKATVYRKFGGSDDQAKLHGGFASTTQNANRQQTAVYPKWSNSRFEAEIEVPSGQKLNLGTVGEQPPSSSTPKYRGGADQILLPRDWSSDWVKSVRDGKTGKIYSLEEFQAKFPDQLKRGN
jgi:hypothetical protein